MGFEIINILKKEKGFTNSQIAQMSGVTLSTLDKITSGVNTNPKLDTLQAICKVLGCTLNDFMDTPVKSDLSQLERAHIKKYRSLDQYGKEAVDGVLDVEYKRCSEAQTRPTPDIEDGLDVSEEYFMELVQRLDPGRQKALFEQARCMIERQKAPSPVSAPMTGDDKSPASEPPTQS